MANVEVKIGRKDDSYQIVIEAGVISRIHEYVDFREYSSVFIITDSNVGKMYLDKLRSSIIKDFEISISEFTFPAGEDSKKIETVIEIYKKLAEVNFDRKGLIINIGGGVTTDMGGFVASTYLRGVKFVNISTTIEGMVDASVGGKVGVNLYGLKNYIGAFAQPQAVLMDTDTLKTLDDRNYIAGFAEIIKHGLIYDKEYFRFVISQKPREFSGEDLIKVIEGSCRIKAEVVQIDEKESGLRKILNFGHTIGHAIETLSFYSSKPLLHGEAVAIGMIAEAKISELIGYISQKDFNEIRDAIELSGLPTGVKYGYDLEKILEKARGDKKNEKGKIKWVLLKSIGEADWNIEVDEKFVREAIEYILK